MDDGTVNPVSLSHLLISRHRTGCIYGDNGSVIILNPLFLIVKLHTTTHTFVPFLLKIPTWSAVLYMNLLVSYGTTAADQAD